MKRLAYGHSERVTALAKFGDWGPCYMQVCWAGKGLLL
jgi:hypothetical protein